MQQKMTTFLWFNGQAEEAVKFYLSVFKDAVAGSVMRVGDAGPGPKGGVLTAAFRLFGHEFVALNGGPEYQFTPAVSFQITCDTQAEVDELWNKLTADGGRPGQCGWLEDRFGVSWQVTPRILPELLQDQDKQRAGRVMQAMMQMKKLDIAALKGAADPA
jgi:predicted 3-demethylubiquinone-9 3-methyltransferase (glyoxalase superfamily)